MPKRKNEISFKTRAELSVRGPAVDLESGGDANAHRTPLTIVQVQVADLLDE